MQTLTIEFGKSNQSTEESILNKLTWYDPIKKEMLEFEGTSLTFEYRIDPYLQTLGYDNPYRLLPKPVIFKKKHNTNISRKKDFDHFVKSYNNRARYEVVIIGRDSNGAIVQVVDNDADDFKDELHKHKFKFN